jgi:hypothetical protein
MENETELLDPRPLLLKRMIWDIFPHDPDLIRVAQAGLGLVPDGDEGLDVEHEMSDARIRRAAPLAETLRTLSGYAAEVIRQYLIACMDARAFEEGPSVEIPVEFLDGLAEQNADIIFDSAYAILASLLESGVLVYGREVMR